MELVDFLRLVKRKKQTIVSVVVIFIVFTAIFTFIQPLKYRVESRVLLVQTNTAGNDLYAIARTNEYLGSIMSRVIPSNTFFNQAINSGYKIDKDYFEGDTRRKMKKWEKTVVARSLNESGIIEVSVFHTSKYQGEQIARAVNYVLREKHDLYHGLGENVVIKIIDQPISSKFPVKPNILLNFPLALTLSIIVSLIYIYSFPEPVYNIRLFPKRKKKIKKNNNNDNSENKKDSFDLESKNNKNLKNDNLREDLPEKKEVANLNNFNYTDKGNIDNIL